MKKIYLLLMFLLPVLLLAENPASGKISSISVKSSLTETAFQLEIPVKHTEDLSAA